MGVGKQDGIPKIRKVSLHDDPGCLKCGFDHLSQRLYPHSILSLLVGDTLYYAGAMHVAPSMGRHPPDIKSTSEGISCLVSETSPFSSRFLTHTSFSLFQVVGAWANTRMSLVEYVARRHTF